MTCNGYSDLTSPEMSERDWKIQRKVEKTIKDCIEDLEDTYGLEIDMQYSWSYYEDEEEE